MVAPAATAAAADFVLACDQAAGLIDVLGLPRTILSRVIDLPAAGGVRPQTVGDLTPALQVALPLMAAPALVARVRLLIEDDRLVSTWVLGGYGNDPELTPWLLMAHDAAAATYHGRLVRDRAELVRSWLPVLDAGLPAAAGEAAFELPAQAFTVLMALCDLQRRASYAAALDHTARPTAFAVADVQRALADAQQAADPRWLLPTLALLWPPAAVTAGALAPDVPAALWQLAQLGWVTPVGREAALGEEAARLADALNRRFAALAVWVVGAAPDGKLSSSAVWFVRTPRTIWTFQLGGRDGTSAVGYAADLDTAYGWLRDLFTPLGMPAATTAAASTGALRCPSCGQPTRAGAKFCRHCGGRLAE